MGAHSILVSWAPPSRFGTAEITGYRVARGSWSTEVPASQRSFRLTRLRTGDRYTVSVRALQDSRAGGATIVTLTPGTRDPTASTGERPVVVQSAIGEPATLRQGGPAGQRLRMAGVCVWGVPDYVTGGGGFALDQYENRKQIVATARSWGANHIRLRVLADDYDNDRQGLSKVQRLQMIKDWRDAATSAGLYFYVTWWDSLAAYAGREHWPFRYHTAFPMMTDVHRALGDDPKVLYEPFNEPNSFEDKWPVWSRAMRGTVAHWRSIGYTGVLVIDTPDWSHAYDDDAMTALERYDAGRPGMGGKHQLVYAKHDYASDGWPDDGNDFDAARWRRLTGGADQHHHLIWETEFGNYNGDPTTVHPSWSQQAARFFVDELYEDRQSYVGVTSFVWGDWWDVNALTDASNSTPTRWGRSVRDSLLRAGATRF